jgi:asparagine synthase (glutamine-hydrolysing)
MESVPAAVRRLREGLDSALDEALRPVRSVEGPIGILFSGGVDSALLAWELRSRPGVTLYTLGREGSSDLRAGVVGAERLGLPWEGLPVDREIVMAAELRFSRELDGVAEVSRRVLLALAIAIAEAGSRHLLCGQGADELFLGYAHYRRLSAEEAERRSSEDLSRLRGSDWPRTRRIAEECGKEVLAPYLSPAFEEQARRVPVDLLLPREMPKRFFREWAVERGLPRELAERPKKAVQYGSGVDALVRAMRRPAR